MKKKVLIFILILFCEGFEEKGVMDIGLNDQQETNFYASISVSLDIERVSLISGEEEMYSWEVKREVSIPKGFSGFISLTGYREIETTTYNGIKLMVNRMKITKTDGTIKKIEFPVPLLIEGEAENYIKLKKDDSLKIVMDMDLEKAINFDTGDFLGFENLKVYIYQE